ncbi:hypothetical protein [Priestia aryabhattai]|uniref:hypothetical protein n=1 Tax=Priestia aryabhattai TaxID=412384 RepID=UPI003735C6F3
MSKPELQKIEIYFVGINKPFILEGDHAELLENELRQHPEEDQYFRYTDLYDHKNYYLNAHGKNIAYYKYYEGKK